jgi:hypothetical protein
MTCIQKNVYAIRHNLQRRACFVYPFRAKGGQSNRRSIDDDRRRPCAIGPPCGITLLA